MNIPPPPHRPASPQRRPSTLLVVLAGVCWLGFAVSLVLLLFVWVAVGGNPGGGTGLAWPLTALSVALLVLALWPSVWSARRTARR